MNKKRPKTKQRPLLLLLLYLYHSVYWIRLAAPLARPNILHDDNRCNLIPGINKRFPSLSISLFTGDPDPKERLSWSRINWLDMGTGRALPKGGNSLGSFSWRASFTTLRGSPSHLIVFAFDEEANGSANNNTHTKPPECVLPKHQPPATTTRRLCLREADLILLLPEHKNEIKYLPSELLSRAMNQ